MGNIDRTKKNIKVNSLNDRIRKDLFHKFVDAGGEVTEKDIISQKSKKNKTIFDREKQKDFKKISDDKNKNYRKKFSAKKKEKDPDGKTDNSKHFFSMPNPGILKNTFHRLKIRANLYFMRVTDFSANYFNNNFLHMVNTEYKTALIGIQILYKEIFKQNIDIEYKLTYELNKYNYFNYELIEKISNVYNNEEFNQIVSAYKNDPFNNYHIMDIKSSIISLYRKLYILKPYQQNIFNAFEKSISLHSKIFRKKSLPSNIKRKILKNDLSLIFDKLFPELYWLFCKYHKNIIPLGSPVMDEILKIQTHEKPGSKKKKNTTFANTPNEPSDEKTASIVNETEAKISNEVKMGLRLMRHINIDSIKKIREVYDISKIFSNVKNTDKVLFVYLLFMEFDNEYSLVLTTNKIKYALDYSFSGIVNYKEKFLSHYNEIRKCLNLLKEYPTLLEIQKKAITEKPINNFRYIEYSKIVSDLNKKISTNANTTLMAIKTFMENVSNDLGTLISDCESGKKIIDNVDEIITFDVSIDTDKKLNNRGIFEVLKMTYLFTNAFVYRLGIEGDLYGNLEFSESEIKALKSKNIEQPNDTNGKLTTDTKKKSTPNENENINDKSIIDELYDIV